MHPNGGFASWSARLLPNQPRTPQSGTASSPRAMAPSTTPLKQDIQIRQFRRQDLAQVAEIFSSGLMLYSTDPALEYRWLEYVRRSLQTDLADIHATYIRPGGNFWVATMDNAAGESVVVGMIGVQAKADGLGEVRRVSVAPNYHRLGIGRRLMTHLEQWTKTHGFTRLLLEASHARKSALDFYASVGFQHVKTIAFWENPVYEAYVMVKVLA